nr:PREDICTED: uncharacterized protein LOC108226828 [Daucus carota subsp. sativus]
MLRLMKEMDSSKNKKKTNAPNIEIIPENAPYMDDSHITVRSFADESFSDEDVEQEEVSKLSTKRKRDVQDVAANENRNSEEPEIGSEKDGSVPVPETSDQPFQKKPKKKTSGVWEYMDTINVKGVERYKCTLCSKLFLKSKTSSTSSMKRHLEKCVKAHSGTLQPQLQVRRGLGDEVQVSAFVLVTSVVRWLQLKRCSFLVIIFVERNIGVLKGTLQSPLL